MADCDYYDSPRWDVKTCPERKTHVYLRGQKCDKCGTYFRGDLMG